VLTIESPSRRLNGLNRAAPPKPSSPGLHSEVLPDWLTQLGNLGLFAVAVGDSSVLVPELQEVHSFKTSSL